MLIIRSCNDLEVVSLYESHLLADDEEPCSQEERQNDESSYARPRTNEPSRSCALPRPVEVPQNMPGVMETHVIGELLSYNDPRTSRGHLRHAGELYFQARPSSPLRFALLLVGSRYTAFDLSPSMRNALRNFAEGKVLQSLQRAVGDPELCVRDDTLQSVILLGLEEKLQNGQKGYVGRTSVHHPGALALLKRRGPANSETEISRFLVHATRNDAIRYALQTDDYSGLSAPVLRNYCDGGLSNPTVLLDEMILKVFSLREHAQKMQRSASPSHVQRLLFENRIRYIWAWTQSWAQLIPVLWRPRRIASRLSFRIDESLCLFSLQDMVTEVFSSVKAAYLYNQWRCVLLAVLELMIQCDCWSQRHHDQQRKTGQVSEAAGRAQQQVLDAICSSMPFFLYNSGLFTFISDDSAKPMLRDEAVIYLENYDNDPQGALDFMGEISNWLTAVSLWNTGLVPGLRDHKRQLTFCKSLYESIVEQYSKTI